MKKYNKKDNIKNNIIKRQREEIEKLKSIIEEKDNEIQKKDDEINLFKERIDLFDSLEKDYHKKNEEYNNLINDVRNMRKVFSKSIFKKRWNFIKLFLK